MMNEDERLQDVLSLAMDAAKELEAARGDVSTAECAEKLSDAVAGIDDAIEALGNALHILKRARKAAR